VNVVGVGERWIVEVCVTAISARFARPDSTSSSTRSTGQAMVGLFAVRLDNEVGEPFHILLAQRLGELGNLVVVDAELRGEFGAEPLELLRGDFEG